MFQPERCFEVLQNDLALALGLLLACGAWNVVERRHGAMFQIVEDRLRARQRRVGKTDRERQHFHTLVTSHWRKAFTAVEQSPRPSVSCLGSLWPATTAKDPPMGSKMPRLPSLTLCCLSIENS